MTKRKALLLRPVVFVLDFFISLTGAQTFKEARAVSRRHLNEILSRPENINTEKNLRAEEKLSGREAFSN